MHCYYQAKGRWVIIVIIIVIVLLGMGIGLVWQISIIKNLNVI